MIRKNFYILGFLILIGINNHLAAIPFANDKDVGDSGHWAYLSAKEALKCGFVSLSISLFEDALRLADDSDLNKEQINQINYDLSSAYIALNNLEKAEKHLLKISSDQRKSSKYLLRQAIIEYQLKSFASAFSILKQVNVESLPNEDICWYYFLKGMYAFRDNKFAEAKAFYDEAIETAVSEVQKAQFAAIKIQIPIVSGTVTEELAKGLEAEISAREGSPYMMNDRYLIDYPVILNDLGEKEKAIAFIEKQLTYKLIVHSEYRERLLILLALISGEDTEQGQKALFQVIKGPRGRSVEVKKIALFLLAKGSTVIQDTEKFKIFLDDLIVKNEITEILDELYVLRAKLLLIDSQYALAKEDAQTVITNLPGSPLVPEAKRILAFIAWKAEPPQYRTAANYLSESRSEVFISNEWAKITQLAADCYFLNADYELALSFYLEILNKEGLDYPLGTAFYQAILTNIYLDNLSAAKLLSSDQHILKKVDATSYWKAEWNIVTAIIEKEGVLKAFQRMDELSEGLQDSLEDPILQARFSWLKVRLLMDLTRYDEALSLADKLIAQLKIIKDHKLTEQVEDIVSSTLLLKGRILLNKDQLEPARGVFNDLRQKYSFTEAAILSYLEESRYYTSKSRTVDAQQKLNELIDRYPDNENVPLALYEAALNAERRGSNSSYEEALTILERLATKYPENSLYYYARLKQGDLLRRINDFSTAQLVYKNLIKTKPEHTEHHRALLSYADCLLESAGEDVKSINEAVFALERIFNTSDAPLDLRVEAGYKCAFGLQKKKDTQSAKEMLFVIITRFLINGTLEQRLYSNSEYWIARSVFDLGKLYEAENEFRQAIQAYNYIIDYALPGKADAQSMINNLLR